MIRGCHSLKIKEKQPFFRVIFRVLFPQKKGYFILKYAFAVDAPKTPETLVNKGKIQHLQGLPHPSKKADNGNRTRLSSLGS